MTEEQRAARLFQTWLESEAPELAPTGLLDQITTATRSARPRPAWMARLEGHHVDIIEGGRRSSAPRLGLALAVIGLILAIAGALAFAGSQRPTTPVRPEASQAAIASAGPDTSPRPSSTFVWPNLAVQPGDPIPDEMVGTWYAWEFNEYDYIRQAGDPFCVSHWKTTQACLTFYRNDAPSGFYRNADIVTLVDGKLRFWPIGTGDRCQGQASLVSFKRTGNDVHLTVEPNQCFTDMSDLTLVGVPGGPATAPSLPPN